MANADLKINTIVDSLRQQNSRAPISRLHPEILAIVFQHVRDACFADRRLDDSYRQRMDWVAVTHVCNWWRDVALHAPQLWTNIHISRVQHGWYTEMLHRSKQRKLKISVDLRPIQFFPSHVILASPYGARQ